VIWQQQQQQQQQQQRAWRSRAAAIALGEHSLLPELVAGAPPRHPLCLPFAR
jgi:hypothetical protein